MTRTDTFVVGALVLLLAVVAGLIGAPALTPTASTPSLDPTEPPVVVARPYREGILGGPVSVSPLTARSQVDRDLVALVFSGLVRNGPGATLVPDLAERWEVDTTGTTWTVTLRDGATWHDGAPVTAADVVYTIKTMQDPEYAGPSAGSWSEVSVTALSDLIVQFTLTTPLGGFLQALTQPIAPAHLLGDVPVGRLPEHPFGLQPVGSGPFALVELTPTSAVLVPAAGGAVIDPEATPSPSGAPGSAAPTERPERPVPYLDGIEFRFALDGASIITAFDAGELDGISNLSPATAVDIAAATGSRLLRYPGTTLTTVLLNQRPDHPEFRDMGVRAALLGAIDRQAIIDDAFAGAAVAASGPIPPSDEYFDAEADAGVAFDPDAAVAALEKARWTRKDGAWFLDGGKDELTFEVLSPSQDSNPALFAAAASVVADWKAIGIKATHVALPPGEFATERLATGDFDVAVTDVAIGMDPDLYPLLASTQTLTGGSNVSGVQDERLDRLMIKARAPGTDAARAAAYTNLQKHLATGRFVLPIAFADEVVVVHGDLEGVEVRQVTDPSDRFWDVLTWRLADGR